MKSLLLALQFMTRLPLPALEVDEAIFARAIRWFPAVGLVVGAAVAGAVVLPTTLGLRHPEALGALLALLVWTGVTGALHLDGLGDIADAAGAAHKDPARLSAVLADPHIGSFGVVAIVLQLVAKLVLLVLIAQDMALYDLFLPLVLVPVLARIGPLAWATLLPPLHQGMGSLFRAGAKGWVLSLWLLPAIASALATRPALLLVLPVIPLWSLWLRQRIGGISGDGHGAGIELLETAGLLVLAVSL